MSERLKIEAVNALAELERLKWKYEIIGNDEIRCTCPAHEDKSPSVSLNVKKNLWKCHAASCGAKGDIITFIAHATGVKRGTVIHELSGRYALQARRTINPETVEKFHQRIWDAGPLLQELYKRGVTDDDIRKARLGFHDGRITIPIYQDGEVVNVRRYLPGAPGPEKMRNSPGYGGQHLYQEEQTKFDRIIICAGEIKALVTARLMNDLGYGAVSITVGEGNWDPKFNPKFANKMVYVMYDVDAAGLKGSNLICGYLYYTASSCKIVRLPLDLEKFPKGDINDWVYEGGTPEQLEIILQESAEWRPPDQEKEVEEKPRRVTLSNAVKSDNVGRRIELESIVSAMDTTPYIIPKDVAVSCTKDQPNCPWCPVRHKEFDPDTGSVLLTIKGTSPGLLEMINAPKKGQKEAIKEALRIPPCKVVSTVVKTHVNVVDVRLAPTLNIGQQNSENTVQQAFVIGHGLEMNSPYILSGKPFPQPRNQQATLLIDQIRQGEDSLNSYAPSSSELEALEIFQPSEWTVKELEKKLDHLYCDLETNVTRIFHRRDIHLLIDLTYHSVLMLDFDGQHVKGWMNTLIVGDSSQGKSETNIRLMEHYRLGERVECKNATVAGLLGGLDQLGTNRWFVSWGVIPTHDRRLVVLEEIKGTDSEVLAKLTDMRSSGIAEIPKIKKCRAFARTRLIFVSNPRTGRPVSAYNFGIETIKELMGGLEDMRRLDAALVVSAKEVDPSVINKLNRNRPQVDHTYTGDLCKSLVLWSWTRSTQQVRFEAKAIDIILDEAVKFCEKFSESLPLVDRGTMRHKIARLSAALAARTYSTGENHNELLVRDCHVEFIAKWLDKVYSSPVFGYFDFSRAQIHANAVRDVELVERRLTGMKYAKDLVDSMLYADNITLEDLQDWCDIDKEESRSLLSFLVRKHAIYRHKHVYLKTADFIKLLKDIESKDLPSVEPDKEEF